MIELIDKEKIEEIANRYGIDVSYTDKGKGKIIPDKSDIKVNKFEYFTDDELYILKRQAMESSWVITCSNKYSNYNIKLHNKLMNEIIDEIKRREN